MILCLGSAADDTFLHTVDALRAVGARFDAFDLGQLALAGALEVPLDDVYATTWSLHGQRFTLRRYDAVFIRVVGVGLTAVDPHAEIHAHGIATAFAQVLDRSVLPVINPILRDRSNAAKLFHAVETARLAGWRIPRACLTNEPDTARAFIASCPDGVIFKGASAAKTWTTLYEPVKHDQRLSLVEGCPVLFQERIVGPDIRVHVIADHTFGERIDSPEVDYRIASSNSYHPIVVQDDIAAECATVTRCTGIPFLGMDFKIQRATGAWFFLEANPMPQYEAYDRRAGGTIARALVSWLLEQAEAKAG